MLKTGNIKNRLCFHRLKFWIWMNLGSVDLGAAEKAFGSWRNPDAVIAWIENSWPEVTQRRFRLFGTPCWFANNNLMRSSLSCLADVSHLPLSRSSSGLMRLTESWFCDNRTGSQYSLLDDSSRCGNERNYIDFLLQLEYDRWRSE